MITVKPQRADRSNERIRKPQGLGALLAIGLCTLIAIAGLPAAAQDVKKSEWNGYEMLNFNVDGRGALLVVPKKPAPGNHWIWRTEFFGVEAMADVALLDEGIYVAYVGVGGLFGAPVALDAMDKFYDHVTKVYKLNPKVVLEGFSRGGLYALNWGIRHPDRVACMYLDAPVCDFKSWPGGGGRTRMSGRDWRDCLNAYKMTDAEARAYKGNPIDNLEPLAKAKIPIFVVCGDMHDWIVAIEGNSLLLQERYTAMGGPITLIKKPGAGHRPHSLQDPTPIVNFVLKYTTGGKMPEGKLQAQAAKKAAAAAQTIDTIPFKSKPDKTAVIQAFDSPKDIGDLFGARIQGFVYPPKSGEYVFAIAGDDTTKLFLSTNEDPKNMALIASAPEWTEAANFKKFPSQMSKPVRLEAGKKYYIAGIHKENTGGDFMSVGWIVPGTTEVVIIKGADLSPYPTGERGKINHEIWLNQETWPDRNK